MANLKFFFLSILILISNLSGVSSFAQTQVGTPLAGPGTTGGGGGLLCTANESKRFADDTLSNVSETELEKSINSGGFTLEIIDYYEANLPMYSKNHSVVQLQALSETETLKVLMSTLDEYPGFKNQVQAVLNEIKGPLNWGKGQITIVPDAKLFYVIQKNCTYVQLAARDEDGIYLNQKFENVLKPYQKALLQFHEAIYWIAGINGITTSESVRRLFRFALSLKSDLSPEEYSLAVKKLGEKIQIVSKKSYLSKSRAQEIRAFLLEEMQNAIDLTNENPALAEEFRHESKYLGLSERFMKNIRKLDQGPTEEVSSFQRKAWLSITMIPIQLDSILTFDSTDVKYIAQTQRGLKNDLEDLRACVDLYFPAAN